jgi:hypothetical protein
MPKGVGLTSLPAPVLTRIAAQVLALPPSAESAVPTLTLRDTSALSAVVVLCRVHPALRRAAASALSSIDLADTEDGARAWPAIRVIAHAAWPGLDELRVTVDRARLVGFLRWLIASPGLRVLHLTVVGKPYAHDGLAQVEKMLLGRLLLRTAARLESLHISGIDSTTVLLSVVCRCTVLREFELHHYSPEPVEDNPPSPLPLYLVIILCLVNKGHIKRICLPFTAEQAAALDVPGGTQLQETVEGTWATLWPSYRAGAKEAAANLPADEADMTTLFAKMNSVWDAVESSMSSTLADLRQITPNFGARERTVDGLLKTVFPSVSFSFALTA